MIDITQLSEWQMLLKHHAAISSKHLREWFKEDNDRFNRFSLNVHELLLDYSRNHIQSETISLLAALTESVNLHEKIAAFFDGLPVNATEKRPALHTALRAKHFKNSSIFTEIINVREKMQSFTAQIHEGKRLGSTGKPIQHIVNIGIGGSHHGPLMTTLALKDFAINSLSFHFISTVDQAHLNDVLEKIDLERALFIISSKSFTTIETMTNAETIYQFLCGKLSKSREDIFRHHFIAITANLKAALAFGIPADNIFKIWDWVGGRYSIWSAIGLPLMLMIGATHFDAFLHGASEMDEHFKTAKNTENMPILLALLGLWTMHFYNTSAHAIIPYSHRLRHFITYLQQADMESNGKSVNLQGEKLTLPTSPVIFGAEGCDGQHTYHQLLHQGNRNISVDFLMVLQRGRDVSLKHHEILIASGLSQAEALMRGKTSEEIYQELLQANYSHEEALFLSEHKAIPGNRSSNVIFLKRLTPRNLGALLALYEHKIFVQGAIWGINSFDQWGVELGKQLLPNIINRLKNINTNVSADCATEGLINHYQKNLQEIA